MITPVMTDANVITVPTERSIPPVMMTKVTPTARIPMTAVDSKMPTILVNVAKLGDASEKTTNMTMRLAKARTCCNTSERIADRLLGTALLSIISTHRPGNWSQGGKAHHGFFGGFVGRKFARDPPFAHHDDPVAHPQDLR